jgi:hypothetical protein
VAFLQAVDLKKTIALGDRPRESREPFSASQRRTPLGHGVSRSKESLILRVLENGDGFDLKNRRIGAVIPWQCATAPLAEMSEVVILALGISLSCLDFTCYGGSSRTSFVRFVGLI